MMTIEQAARRLGVPRAAVHNLIAEGVLRSERGLVVDADVRVMSDLLDPAPAPRKSKRVGQPR